MIAGIAAVIAAGLLVQHYYLSGAQGEKKPGAANGGPAAPVLTAVARTGTAPVLLTAIGNVQARSTVEVKSRVDGQVVEVAVSEGQRVRKGDLLFRIDPRPFEAQLRQAQANLARDKANLEKAESDLARYQSLSEKGYSSQQRYEEATALKASLIATMSAQEAAIEIARLNLEFTDIHSPIDGRAGSILVNAGNLVEANDDKAMLVITETNPIFVSFNVPERHLARIKQRMGEGRLTANVSIPGEGGAPLAGEIFFINNAVDMTTGTIQLKARYDNAKERLTPGQFVNVSILLAELHQAVLVPSRAVQSSQKGPFVYVVKADKTVDMRMVELGPAVDQSTVISSGVANGETVVTDGQLRLFPGRKVAPKPADSDGGPAPAQS
ncbi:MAG: efflux RND transporter periplasmic adaptor subunit [Hyphomicrobiales bacterium]